MKTKQFNKIWHESSGFKKRMTFASVTISPQFAQELLELNTNNRPVRTSSVRQISETIKEGKWIENGDSIRISKSGVLIDGQHRLEAIIQAGMPIAQDVAVGLDDQAFAVIDTGRRRSKADTISVMGLKNASILANAIDLLYAYRVNKDIHIMNRKVQSNEDIVQYIDQLRASGELEFIEELVSQSSIKNKRLKAFSPALWAVIDFILKGINTEQADYFIHSVVTGDGVSSRDKTSPMFLLRNKLIETVTNGKIQFRLNYKLALVFKAWNAFREGKVMKQLSWDDRQDFPQPK